MDGKKKTEEIGDKAKYIKIKAKDNSQTKFEAGFGGQGVLSMGKILAYAGLMEGKEVTWMPAYGPEQRGGTANVTVIVSDDPVSSPILSSYDIANAEVVYSAPARYQVKGQVINLLLKHNTGFHSLQGEFFGGIKNSDAFVFFSISCINASESSNANSDL